MNENEMLNYIEKYNLQKCLKVVLKQSISLESAVNPYHNNLHALCVFYNAMKIIDDINEKQTVISWEQARVLGIACLFHDCGHDGGKFNLCDEDNVKIAIKKAQEYLNEYDDSKSFDAVKILIEATEFPYKLEPFNILEEIIRDADLMMIFEPNLIYQMVCGIWKEYIQKGNFCELDEVIEWCIGFYSDVNYYTNYAKRMKETKLSYSIEKLEKLINILT
ncbi:MAG: 3'5'-cyclic nucleotide phosphodiesterase [Bacteriophage sp.]|jgi:hypothetical protein|uniref:Metal dependent phosphohydrolases with conserved 'HD' motif n=1 Tax=Myoviridae sp. ctNQV2 TaxID=2827683 RepID=A0A8S5RY74_9CAUD|nr:MAG: 3'5'-cyclic nucleotide phosphodiesterase [Bacteriophage sp.]DAF43624.1 MAG TPA: Metal dependent phosphohydrolases with conserved 'HD' motif [Myoviridae sp. ctNQV2]UVX33112.1 MAG: 3'5'-cyclic nucleotide phosphodiesterase [Bacteriophage sp.]UVY03154.1 MAG: 3'5'-cyclic nucleotide phosphodiesterase [Bacteriophage sp.]UWF79034.1 MAG: 3'5'-cyclic nucleotide phosphodiesterase [Bacteriophage sp.]